MNEFSIYCYDADTGDYVEEFANVRGDRAIAAANTLASAGYHIKVFDSNQDVVYMVDAM